MLDVPEGHVLVEPSEFDTYPFYRQVWPGGAALALYLFEHPSEVRDRAVLDIGTGGGIVARMAYFLGAMDVTGLDRDANAIRQAKSTQPDIYWHHGDFMGFDYSPEVITVGDMFYDERMTDALQTYLVAQAQLGRRVLVGDPGRPTFPVGEYRKLAEYPSGSVYTLK